MVCRDGVTMGDTFDFREFLGAERRRAKRRLLVQSGIAVLAGASLGLSLFEGSELNWRPAMSMVSGDIPQAESSFACDQPKVVDGDTIRCGASRVRLGSIDAPEMPGHCAPRRVCAPGDPHASAKNLTQLMAGSTITCRRTGTDRYGRTVALCQADGKDLSCAQVEGGFAIRRYGVLHC